MNDGSHYWRDDDYEKEHADPAPLLATTYPACPLCGKRVAHTVGCPEMDRPR